MSANCIGLSSPSPPLPLCIKTSLDHTASILPLESGDTTAILLTPFAVGTQPLSNCNNSLRRQSTVPAPDIRRALLTSCRASGFNGLLDFLLVLPAELREAIDVCVGHDPRPLPEAAVVVPVRDFAIEHGRLGKAHEAEVQQLRSKRPRWGGGEMKSIWANAGRWPRPIRATNMTQSPHDARGTPQPPAGQHHSPNPAAPRPALRELCWADFEPPGHSLAPLRHPAEGTARRFGTKQRTQTTAALITAAARPAVLPARLSPQAASTRLPRGTTASRSARPRPYRELAGGTSAEELTAGSDVAPGSPSWWGAALPTAG